MNNKIIRSITAAVMLMTFTVVNTHSVSASSGSSGSSIAKPKSKLTAKKKKVKTYTYNTVKSKANKRVPTATKRVKLKLDLTTAIPKIGADYSYNLGYTGAGSYVAIIDTGVEKAHPFLAGKVAIEACFATRCPNGGTEMVGPGAAVPVHYHGTHVAGIIAGSNGSFHGIAPDAKIIAINIFDAYGGAYDDDMVKALNYVYSLADQYNITSVNMSLGGGIVFKGPCDDYLPDVTNAIRNLKAKNIATVISAGNSYALGMNAPGCISDAVSVAATSTATDKVTDFSNVSQYTTLSAPGLSINSSKLMGSYGAASGTSMSAPFVAGAFAVYRSKFGVQTVSKVVSDFQSTAAPAVDTYTGIITKRINVKAVIDQTPNTNPIVTTTTVPVVTTTTVPVVTTTTTTVPKATVGKPILVSLDSMSSIYRSYTYDIFAITYVDVTFGKDALTSYLLTCDGGQTFSIPVETGSRLHYHRIKNADGSYASAVAIKSCYLQGIVASTLGPKSWWEDVYRS